MSRQKPCPSQFSGNLLGIVFIPEEGKLSLHNKKYLHEYQRFLLQNCLSFIFLRQNCQGLKYYFILKLRPSASPAIKATSLSRLSLSLPSSYPGSDHSVQSSSALRTRDLASSNSAKSFRQLKLSTSFLTNSDSVSSYLGHSYKHFSNGFSTTSTASKSR